MTTSVFQVNADNLDGSEINDDTWYGSGFDSDGLFIGPYTSVSKTGLIFPNVTIPVGATITNAYVEMFAKWQAGAGDPLITWKGIAEDNCAVWATDGSNRPSTRSYEATTVDQTVVEANITDEDWFSFADISSVVQAVVDRAGWASGNRLGLAIYMRDSGSARNQWHDYNYGASFAAKLNVTYTVPAKGLIMLMGDGGFM